MGCRSAALPVSSVTFHDLWKISAWVGYCILTTQMLTEGMGRDRLWEVDMKAVSTDWWNCILVLGWIPSMEWRWETGARRLGDTLGNVGSCEIKTDRCMGVLPAPSASVRFYLWFYLVHRVYKTPSEETYMKIDFDKWNELYLNIRSLQLKYFSPRRRQKCWVFRKGFSSRRKKSQ